MPTEISASTLPDGNVDDRDHGVVLVGDEHALAVGLDLEILGIGERRDAAHDLELVGVDHVDRIVVAGADQHSLKSGVMRMPRGRAPVLISLIGCIVVLSSTVTVLSFSLLMKSW